MNYAIVFVFAFVGSVLESWKQTYPAFDPKLLIGGVLGAALITYGFNFLGFPNIVLAALYALLTGAGVLTLIAKPATLGVEKMLKRLAIPKK
jgi:hypothetical protein